MYQSLIHLSCFLLLFDMDVVIVSITYADANLLVFILEASFHQIYLVSTYN